MKSARRSFEFQFLHIYVAFTLAMLVQTTNSMRVAVLGSGVAGSSVARTLADKGMQVTVFEAGFGIGGRTSTRRTRDEFRYQFDHGAQYIGKPQTEAFRDTLNQWKSDGWVKQWPGRFLTADGLRVKEDEAKDRFVGYPGMNSICQNLLQHKNITVRLQTRANASRNLEEKWELINGKTKEGLGTFDWLVASDRLSGDHYRRDLSGADVKEFTSGLRKIKSVKSLTAMVVFEKPLGIDIDGVKFTGNDAHYGSLGWVARDSSKPGRERDDDKECWVLQSHPDAAKDLLKGKRKVGEIREMAKEVLLHDFLKSIPRLAGDANVEVPAVAASIGHRWGAAFPIPPKELMDMESQLVAHKTFVACGDYFKLSGRVEGAYLSGVSAANQLYNEIS